MDFFEQVDDLPWDDVPVVLSDDVLGQHHHIEAIRRVDGLVVVFVGDEVER
jgi:hypothetical protein